MKTQYDPEDLLPLSGIQHFHFCRRQWALIHVERQWQDNVLTVEGKLLHERADNPFEVETRRGVIISRSMPVVSYQLGLQGVCDVVEFIPSPDGVNLFGHEGIYLPAPVEYKRGKEKRDACDEVQICAQAMCLEEMLSVSIPSGYLYYGKTRHRCDVFFTEELRNLVVGMAAEMHELFTRGYTPRVKPSRACQSCSLAGVCLPGLMDNVMPASKYIQKYIEGA